MAADETTYLKLLSAGIPHLAALAFADPDSDLFDGTSVAQGRSGGSGGGLRIPTIEETSAGAEQIVLSYGFDGAVTSSLGINSGLIVEDTTMSWTSAKEGLYSIRPFFGASSPTTDTTEQLIDNSSLSIDQFFAVELFSKTLAGKRSTDYYFASGYTLPLHVGSTLSLIHI